MPFGFNELQTYLINWPPAAGPNKSEDPIIERIRQILSEYVQNQTLAKVDLIPLLRHLLLREQTPMRVPVTPEWPSREEWEQHQFNVMPHENGNGFHLEAQTWNPEWLGNAVFSDAFSNVSVRENGSCSADPFIANATGFNEYSSPGQREAIRAAFLIPKGDTLIVNLPTGSGKSLVGQAPALVLGDGHLTLFVVPTVALALDQARQMEPLLKQRLNVANIWPLAWFGGLSAQERRDIKNRMRLGTQRILFTSPEALIGSLLQTVFDIAKANRLRYLVIDEAHLVSQWGDEFRPAFQVLAGLRNRLLQTCQDPFRTLLLSATYTPETIETLANLFGPQERVHMVASVHLRPEIQYWWYQANDTDDKRQRILEALRYAPRPFILYVTKRNDAQYWYNTLIQSGHTRISRFDGQTPNDERGQIIDAWRANQLDGIVATSAFGVGIDKQDVRTVIHATIPETLDRFYQEVGRGGRDGRPSVSLLIYENSDWNTVTNMATPAIITAEFGLPRWQAMFKNRINQPDGSFSVSLDALRTGLNGTSDTNRIWNMRTLLLMSRGGFLTLELEPVDQVDRDNDDYTPTTLGVRLLRYDHLAEEAWNTDMEQARQLSLQAGNRNLNLMKSMLEQKHEVSTTLMELYQNEAQWPVSVTRVCGGCPADRHNANRPVGYNVPIASPIKKTSEINLDQWNKNFPDLRPPYITVFYEPDNQRNMLLGVLRWLVRHCGVQEVSAERDAWINTDNDGRSLYQHAPSRIVLHRSLDQLCEEPYTPLARVTVFNKLVSPQNQNAMLLIRRPLHIMFYPLQTPDPNNPDKLLIDIALHSIRLEQLHAAITQ